MGIAPADAAASPGTAAAVTAAVERTFGELPLLPAPSTLVMAVTGLVLAGVALRVWAQRAPPTA